MAFKLDLSKFKKVSGGKDHTVMRDQKGNEIKVAHSQLSPKMRGQLAELPVHMAEGGEVEDPTKPEPGAPVVVNVNAAPPAALPAAPAAPEAPAQPFTMDGLASAVGPNINAPAQAPQMPPANEIPQAAPDMMPSETSKAPDMMPSRAPAAPAATAPTSAALPGVTNDAQLAGLQLQKTGVQGEANAQAAQAQQQANVLKQFEQLQKQSMVQQQQFLQEHAKEVKAFNDDVKNSHIDPQRYMGSKTTGQKVMTAIGLILGGIGGGLTHQENPALKFINAEIDRDIEAQKAEQGKRKTLLEANMQQFKDQGVAMELTRAMQLNLVKTQLQVEEAKATDPIVKARAQQAIGKLDVEIGGKLQEAAKMRTLNQLVSGAQQNPDQLQATIDVMRSIDPKRAEDLQNRLVPGMGIASTLDDAKEVKKLNATIMASQDGIKELIKMTNKTGTSLSMDDRSKASVIAGTLRGLLRVPITGPGAMNESEIKLLESIVANPTKIFSLDSSTRSSLKTLSQRLGKTLEYEAKARGVNVPSPESKLTPQQKSFVDWARANPQDKRATIILEKLGLE